MDRYKISNTSVKNAIKFLKDGTGTPPTWARKYKNDMSVKGNKLYYNDREVISKERVNDVLRGALYKKGGDMPSGRDSAFHLCKQRYVGISRRALMDFIRSQKALGEVKAAQNKPKRSSGERLKNYVFETDLVFLKKNDLEQANKKFIRDDINDLTYFLTVTEKVTGLTKFAYVKKKEPAIVTPLVVKLAKEMCKSLKTTTAKCDMRMDKGGEFAVKELAKHFKKAYNVSTGVHVENKNAQFQKCFFQILRQRKATDVKDAMGQAEILLNNTYNRIHGKTSNELVEQSDEKQNIKKFNKARKSYIAGDKRNPFEVGDYVRIQIKPKKADIGFKRYKNITYGKRVFKITKKTKKAVPVKYRVNGTWYLQASLVKSAPRDEKSIQLVEERDQEFKQKHKKKRDEHQKKRKEEIVEQEQKKKRPSRKAAKAAKLKMLQQMEASARIDDQLDEIEEHDEKVEEAPPPKKNKKVLSQKHDTMIRYLKKRNLPTGGSLAVLEKRINKFKQNLKKQAIKK